MLLYAAVNPENLAKIPNKDIKREENLILDMDWEVSIVKLKECGKEHFKVTRRLPNLSVSETKLFDTKEEAKKQFEEWLK